MTKNNKFRPAVAKRQIAQFAKNKTTVKIGLLVKCWFLLLVKQTKNIPICDWHILFGDTGQMTSLWSKWHYWSKWHQFAQNDTTLVKMTLLWSKWQTFFVKMASLWPKSHHFGLVTSLSDTNPLSCLLLTHLFCEVSENDYYKLFSHRNLKRNISFKAPCPALKLSKQVRSLDCQCCPSETLCVFEKFHSGQGAPFAKARTWRNGA